VLPTSLQIALQPDQQQQQISSLRKKETKVQPLFFDPNKKNLAKVRPQGNFMRPFFGAIGQHFGPLGHTDSLLICQICPCICKSFIGSKKVTLVHLLADRAKCGALTL
jgi:hypothetical protein